MASKKPSKTELALKALTKLDGNKTCANCPEKMPGYAEMTHCIFVCTKCAGIHRDFQFKIKGISMSVFSDDDVAVLKSVGNTAHNSVYMARHSDRDGPIPSGSDVAKLKDFIRMKYQDRRWYDQNAAPAQPASAAASPAGFPQPKSQQQRISIVFQNLSSAYAQRTPPCSLPYENLVEWTNGFKGNFYDSPAGIDSDGPQYGLIGKGAFGEVFRGLAVCPLLTRQREDILIAVKRMDLSSLKFDDGSGAAPGTRDSLLACFRREIHVLSQFRHPNIVKLIGFCEAASASGGAACLVYELLPLGSLASQLASDDKAALMPWTTRLGILLQIATAINFLHCHDPGHPAYHRDIKAENIGVATDYTAKLIDCGLSKYIPEDGAGRSILSAEGGRFGTPGYMCPFYNDGIDFDAKCEIYSLGIVVLEVLTGCMQGAVGADGKKVLLHRSMGRVPADARAGVWPAGCSAALLALAKECVSDYDDRIESMKAVMQRLGQIKADFNPAPAVTAADYSVFQLRMTDLIAQNEAFSRARDADAAAATESRRTCLVCFDDELHSPTDGFECASNRHFVCRKNGCFEQIAKDQAAAKATFQANGCHIVCTLPDCREVVEDHVVAVYAGAGGFDAFLRAKVGANEERLVRDYEDKMRGMRTELEREIAAGHERQATVRTELEREIAAGHERQATVLRHRNHIIEEILTIKCPNQRCQMPFIMDEDFDFCFALSCDGCNTHYCGWCLVVCAGDAHDHAENCRPRDQQPRGLFPQGDTVGGVVRSARHWFDRVHGPRRAAATKAYLDAQRMLPEDRAAVVKTVGEQWDLPSDNIVLL